ncbi:uncharacterized protein LOC121727074 [Aricia agestis]|uniref:uncharacterized protein LOC121727074 n=1 Tax=Aricia agestis TaxID=91739 RepID=UPI001C205DEF|nr:uncharacterized protein LOC121727074 [Aricia agestis]
MKRFCDRFLLKYSKTVDIRTEFDDVTAAALMYQGLFGQQVLDPEWTWRKHFVHQLLNLCLFVYVFFGTLECLNTTTDIELIAEAFYTLILIVFFPIKMLLFIKNRFVFRKLYATAKLTLMEVIKADPDSDVSDVLKTIKRMVYFLFSTFLIPCFLYELTALWNYVGGHRTLLSRSTETLMPMTSPYYEVAWFLHTIFLFEISSTMILDLWFVLLIFVFYKSVDALINILGNEKEMYRERLGEKLKKFYAVHVLQVEYMNTLTSMYKWLAFVPLCNAAMGMCVILLLMSNELNWKFAPHMLPMFAEIFAYNWFGEQIKTKAHQLQDCLMNFDWIHLKEADRRSYYIMMTYMNKEFGIRTAIGSLSLVTMTTVLKLSYQTFTVLRTYNS